MRLSHYALALTIILLAITGYLAWEAQEEAKGARKELELVRKQQAAHEMAVPAKPVTVVEAHIDQGFAVISAGKDKQLTSGMKFDVRRGNGLVGRVIVGDTIEAAEAVVDIDTTATLPGVRIEAGDELILPIRK